MFRFHERTQRHLCRGAFFAFCAVPVVSTSLWAVRVRTASHRANVVERFEKILSVPISIDRVFHPRPGATAVEGLTLGDSTSRSIATINRVDMLPIDARGDRTWRIARVRTPADYLFRLLQQIRHPAPSPDQPNHITVDQVTLLPRHSPAGHASAVLSDFSLDRKNGISDGVHRSEINLRFRLKDSAEGEGVCIRIVTSAGEHGDAVHVEFESGSSAIPAWAVAELFPAMALLGPAATFRGKGSADYGIDSPAWQFTGEVSGIDFARVLRPVAKDSFRAEGAMIFDSLSSVGGRMDSASGSVRCGAGAIDSKLLDAAVRALFCERPNTAAPHLEEVSASENAVPGAIEFDEAAFRFELDTTGFAIWGTCDTQQPGAILARDGKPLLFQPRYRRLSVANLVYFIAPHAEFHIPGTRKAQAVARRLPIPTADPVETQ